MVAGEDVLDFHIRIEPTERGLTVIPLGEASLTLNAKDYSEPVSLVVGDCLRVGLNDIVFSVERLQPSEADEWWLYADREESIYKVTGEMGVGRGDDNEILLLDDHVSRYHAKLQSAQGLIWLKDLGWANGTFVNGVRIVGGCRLYHGDELMFDTLRFQLIGKGEDLTAVRRQDSEEENALILDQPKPDSETTEIMAIDVNSQPPPVIPASSQTGAFLLGVSEPVAGLTFPTAIGRNSIGRDEDCDIVLRDPTVSTHRARGRVHGDQSHGHQRYPGQWPTGPKCPAAGRRYDSVRPDKPRFQRRTRGAGRTNNRAAGTVGDPGGLSVAGACSGMDVVVRRGCAYASGRAVAGAGDSSVIERSEVCCGCKNTVSA